jgi:hypothetical protein
LAEYGLSASIVTIKSDAKYEVLRLEVFGYLQLPVGRLATGAPKLNIFIEKVFEEGLDDTEEWLNSQMLMPEDAKSMMKTPACVVKSFNYTGTMRYSCE